MSTQTQPMSFDKTPLPASFFAPVQKQAEVTPPVADTCDRIIYYYDGLLSVEEFHAKLVCPFIGEGSQVETTYEVTEDFGDGRQNRKLTGWIIEKPVNPSTGKPIRTHSEALECDRSIRSGTPLPAPEQATPPDSAGSGQAEPDAVLLAQLPGGYVQPVHPDYPFRAGAGGNSTWAHMVRYAELARYCPRGIIVEVGVGCCDGSTHAFDLGLQKHIVPASKRLHIGVDIHEAPDGSWGPKSEWFQYLCSSSQDQETVDKVWDMLPQYPGENGKLARWAPGILYIDTVHTYEFLKRELEIWPQLVGPDTLMLFHDTYQFGPHEPAPLTQAIIEAVAPGGILHSTHEYFSISEECSGLGCLRPIAGWPVPKFPVGAFTDPHTVSVNGREVSA